MHRKQQIEKEYNEGMAVYSIIKEVVDGVPVYGICIDGHPVLEDVSTDLLFISELVRDFNEYGLDPVHLCDVIYDRLP